MKQYFKSLILTGFVTTFLFTNPSNGMDLGALLGGGGDHGGESAGSLSEILTSTYVIGENETNFPVFSEKTDHAQCYRTHDGNNLKLSYSYDPYETNNPSMPRLAIVEKDHLTVVHHFMKEFSHTVAPEVKTFVENKVTGFKRKREFMEVFSDNKTWIESIQKTSGFSPEILFKEFNEEKEAAGEWKKNLHGLINSEKVNEASSFSIKYQVRTNPGMLKRYEGTQQGPVKFLLPVESKEATQPRTKIQKTKHTSNLSFGVFTLSLDKGAPTETDISMPMPRTFDLFMDSVESIMVDDFDAQQTNALISYNNPRDNSSRLMS